MLVSVDVKSFWLIRLVREVSLRTYFPLQPQGNSESLQGSSRGCELWRPVVAIAHFISPCRSTGAIFETNDSNGNRGNAAAGKGVEEQYPVRTNSKLSLIRLESALLPQ